MKKFRYGTLIAATLLTSLVMYQEKPTHVQAVPQKVPALTLPQPGDSSAHDLNFKLNTKKKNLPQELQIYKFKNKNIKENEFQKTAQKLGINGKVKGNSSSLVIEDGNKYLEINKKSGKILYTNLRASEQTNKTIPTNEEAIRYATEFLQQMDWLPENFEVADVTDNTVIDGTLNPEVDKGTVLSKSVHFYQKIDNRPVYGVSRIVVDIGNNGEIETVRKYHKEFDADQKYAIKSVESAVKELGKNKGIHSIEEGGTDPVIEDVDVVYWEDAGEGDEQPYLQPVYVLKGKYKNSHNKETEFNGVIPAIDSQYTFQSVEKELPTQYHPEKDQKSQNME